MARESGVDIEGHYAYYWHFEGGKVTYLKSYGDPMRPSKQPGSRRGDVGGERRHRETCSRSFQ